MRLTKIKLAGFKSFVDPTTVYLPSNLVGVVGPNGSGKSNVIDAVRWVMGESSAKNLRGESMSDVIFNGSSSRKPVGQASIELVFDNTQGKLGGQFATYTEISVKRLVSRDGQSNYYLNGARCRRRDITDIFLGTGLGPRSYAIIEQGMISRLIEAKPEELRILMEEAAGISKYKERRKETESRIKQTNENLSRIKDLKDELDKQLERLQKQSRTAERYKELKQEERTVKGEFMALQWREMDSLCREGETYVRTHEVDLEAQLANQRSFEAAIEHQRSAHTEATDVMNEIQGQYYQTSAEISNKEQSILHTRNRRRELEQDLHQVDQQLGQAQSHESADQGRLLALKQKLQQLEPRVNELTQAFDLSQAQLTEVEESLRVWQSEWDQFNQTLAEPARLAEVERTKITHLEEQSRQLQIRFERLKDEYNTLNADQIQTELDELASAMNALQSESSLLLQQVNESQERVMEQRSQNHDFTEAIARHRSRMQQINGRIASLETLQESALGKKQNTINQWLTERGLQQSPRLGEGMDVDAGWEKAVETVLGYHLQAICVDELDSVAAAASQLSSGDLELIERGRSESHLPEGPAIRLAARVSSEWDASPFLAGVYCANDLAEAMRLRARLDVSESVITPDGVWIGKNWLRVQKGNDSKSGVLQREKEIKTLQTELEGLTYEVGLVTAQLDEGKALLLECESQREALQSQLRDKERRIGEIKAQRSGKQARFDQIMTRRERITKDKEEIHTQLNQHTQSVAEARARLQHALEKMEELANRRQTELMRRDELRAQLDMARETANRDRGHLQEAKVELQSSKTAIEATQQNLVRVEQQLHSLIARKEQLAELLGEGDDPMRHLQADLDRLLAVKVEVEARLQDARRHVEAIDVELRGLNEKRVRAEQDVQKIRNSLDKGRMDLQTAVVRRQTIQEQLIEAGHDLSIIFNALNPEATMSAWEEHLNDLGQKIARLGPINLAAIDEYAEQQERQKYLESQYTDLTDALNTLDGAIRKIDRETRARFKETFDQVNNGLQTMFPKLFGGGQAYLELTGEDLLDTGVSILARPPGKRISNIHLLSGGEKALTAVALVFAIFELNPAPFCMLDEVDAPLDEANVGRFCELVKAMSERVQFIFITHNKATMEIAQHLNGVTMHEPGVSRLVTVDVAEAVQLVATA